MRTLIEREYSCRIVQWNEPCGAGDGAVYSAYTSSGAYICAESLALLISALQDAEHSPCALLAA